MKLYFCALPYPEELGGDYSVFVWANDPNEAARYWSDYFDGCTVDGWDTPQVVTVYTVPMTGAGGAVQWPLLPRTAVRV